jgi:hypothetical protein
MDGPSTGEIVVESKAAERRSQAGQADEKAV